MPSPCPGHCPPARPTLTSSLLVRLVDQRTASADGFTGTIFKLGVTPRLVRLFWREVSQVLNLSPKHLK